MKKIDPGQAVSILANIGVIVGIVFLSLELRQNNQLLRAEAIGSVLETRMVRNEDVYRESGVAELLVKLGLDEPLTQVETTKLAALRARSNMGWQRDYFLFQEGILPERLLRANLPVMRGAFEPNGLTGHYEHWQGGGDVFQGPGWREVADPDFRNFVEQCVISECASIPK